MTIKAKTEEMLKRGMHYGYSASSSHPKMKPFVFTTRNGVEIFDVEKVAEKLEEVKDVIKKLGSEKKQILLVGTKNEAKELVKKYADEIEMPYVTERWLGGILTNFGEIKGRLNYLKDLVQKRENKQFGEFTKKERLRIDEKIVKMKRYFDGLERLEKVPTALVIIDTKKEKVATAEAKSKGLPVIALISSDCNPNDAAHFVPANDSSLASIEYFLSEITEAYKEGLKSFKEAPQAGDVEEKKETSTKTKTAKEEN